MRELCRKVEGKKASEEAVREGIRFSNKKIWKELNKDLVCDYLENDYAGCVGAAGAIEKGRLYYGFVADCGVCVFDNKGRMKFRTRDEGPNPEIDKIAKSQGLNWKMGIWRKRVRSWYRNNPREKLSYGAFTGEENAMKFVRVGRVELHEGDYVLFYSDGFARIIYSKRFNIARHFSELEDYFSRQERKIGGAEGSLVCGKWGN